MRDYLKPIIEDEVIEIEDVVNASPTPYDPLNDTDEEDL